MTVKRAFLAVGLLILVAVGAAVAVSLVANSKPSVSLQAEAYGGMATLHYSIDGVASEEEFGPNGGLQIDLRTDVESLDEFRITSEAGVEISCVLVVDGESHTSVTAHASDGSEPGMAEVVCVPAN